MISSEALPRLPGVPEYVFSAAVALGTLATCFIYSVDVNSLNVDFITKSLAGDVTVVDRVLPILGGTFALQVQY